MRPAVRGAVLAMLGWFSWPLLVLQAQIEPQPQVQVEPGAQVQSEPEPRKDDFEQVEKIESYEDNDLIIHLEEGQLSVDIYYVPLNQVLHTIAQKSAIELVLSDPADESIVVQFTALPVDKGLEKILKGRDYLLLYGENGQRLKTVKVYARKADKPAQPKRPPQRQQQPQDSRGDGEFSRLIAQALGDINSEERLQAVEELGNKEDEAQAAEILLQVLEHEQNAEVREAALEAMADLEEASSLALQAAKMSLQDQKQDIRLRAVEILSDLEAWDELRQISKSHSDPETRENAAEALEVAE